MAVNENNIPTLAAGKSSIHSETPHSTTRSTVNVTIALPKKNTKMATKTQINARWLNRTYTGSHTR